MEKVLAQFISIMSTALEMSPDLPNVLTAVVVLVPTLRMLELSAGQSVRINHYNQQ